MRIFFRHNPKGFTLVELMITVVVSSLITIAVYASYTSMQFSYVNQEALVDSQQNIRATMDHLTRSIRMAGYNPTGWANAGFCTATSGQLSFTQDLNANGTIPPCGGGGAEPNEHIAFALDAAGDTTADGVADTGATAFTMAVNNAAPQAVGERIAAVEFNYILDDGKTTTAPAAAQLNRIDKVKISLLTRTARRDQKIVDTQRYTTSSGAIWGPYNDNFRRRLLLATVQCRNL